MNRSVWNYRARNERIRFRLVQRGAAFLGLLLVLLAAIVMLVPFAHGQTVQVKEFPGATVGDRLTAAQNLGCSPDTTVTCVLVIAPEMSVFPTGTMPAKCSRCIWQDMRSVSLFEPLKYANTYPGSTSKDQLNAAIASAGSSDAVVVVPPSMADSGDDISNLASNVAVLDFRQNYGGMLLWTNRNGTADRGVNGLRVQIATNLQRNFYPIATTRASVAFDSTIDSLSGRDAATIGPGAGIWAGNFTAAVAAGHDTRAEAIEVDIENYDSDEPNFSSSTLRNHKLGVAIVKGDSGFEATAGLRITTTRGDHTGDGKEGYGFFKGIDIAGVTGTGSVGINLNSATASPTDKVVFPDVGVRVNGLNTNQSITGAMVLGQFVNGGNILSLQRATDTSPTGNFFTARNGSAVSLATLDINGGWTAAAYGPASGGPSTGLFRCPSSGACVVGGSSNNAVVRTNTGSNSDTAGQLTLSGGTASYSFTGTYATAPICIASDTTAAAAVKVATSTSTLTITGTGTDVVNYICVART